MSEVYGAAAELLEIGSSNVGSLSSRATAPKAPLDADAVRDAYRRWAGFLMILASVSSPATPATPRLPR